MSHIGPRLDALYNGSDEGKFKAIYPLHKAKMKPSKELTPVQVRPLAKALEQNDAVEESVKQSADELMLVSAVLQSEVPSRAHSEDVAVALEKVDSINDVMQESAQDLAVVNQLLEEEIDERIELERKLLVTEKALAKAASATDSA